MSRIQKTARTSIASVPWIIAVCLWGVSHGQPSEIPLEDPRNDYVLWEVERYTNFTGSGAANTSQSQNLRIADQVSFPAGHIRDHFLFGSFKNTLLDRDIVYAGQKLNAGLMQRYWLCGGIALIDAPEHSSYLMIGAGINSDFADLGTRDLNTEWIYTHTFQRSPTFRWGVGLDLQQYSGRFIPSYPYLFHKFQIIPYPLFLVDWRITRKTKFVWEADFLEFRQFITHRLAITAGARFNLDLFALKNDASYGYRSVGAEFGLQYSLWYHCYLRLKYKELIAGREVLGLPDGSLHVDKINSGRSLRLNLAYGI